VILMVVDAGGIGNILQKLIDQSRNFGPAIPGCSSALRAFRSPPIASANGAGPESHVACASLAISVECS